jgi:uncharacterized DUF497 family protein
MKDIHFEWDETKNKVNFQKHGISFEEAESVFFDECALLIADPDHSENEDRFVLLGLSAKLRLLLVCHCFEVDDGLIRVISCRKAKRKEISLYRR